jgi:trk system potassium uptake protein TrkH
MKLNGIKRIPITDTHGIVGIVTQKALADAIRVSVLERTFRQYRSSLRDRYKAILANLGFVLQFAGILMVVPALVGTALGDGKPIAGIYLAVVGLFGTGFLFATYGERAPLNLKESSILVLSSFVLLSFYGSIPYMYMNPFWQGIDPISLLVNSLFESASGFTTTGLSMIFEPENLSPTFNFYRSYTQWIGGLSFVYIVMLVFYPEKKLDTIKGLMGAGRTIQFKELSIIVSIIFAVYLAVLTFIFYVLGDRDLLFDISFIMTGLTGGGFVPSSTFLSSYASTSHLFVLMIAMVISALPFAAHYSIYSKSARKRIIGIEVLVYFALLATGSFVFLFLADTTDLLSSSFHIFSASTNTGYQFINLGSLTVEAKIFLIAIMLVGGSAYSAAGGIKIGRLMLLAQSLAKRSEKKTDLESQELVAFAPVNRTTRQEEGPRYDKVIWESTLVIGLFVAVAVGTGYILSYLNGFPFLDSLFESASALTTTGLTIGITSMELDLVSKSVLIVNMIVGKFEIILVLYIAFSAIRRKLR